MKVYGDLNSGNCYKIHLLASLLDIEHDWVAVNILAGETRTEQFLVKNPNGRIPLLELDDGRLLTESNAILNYLAEGSQYLPADTFLRAQVLSWQFFEQYSHEPYIAVARFINRYLGLPAERAEEYREKQAGGHRALAVMERRLRESDYLVGQAATIADIALYAYTHVAHEGGFDLSVYPSVVAWCRRVEGLSGYAAMPGEH
jgi:glutathione S-transferase